MNRLHEHSFNRIYRVASLGLWLPLKILWASIFMGIPPKCNISYLLSTFIQIIETKNIRKLKTCHHFHFACSWHFPLFIQIKIIHFPWYWFSYRWRLMYEKFMEIQIPVPKLKILIEEVFNIDDILEFSNHPFSRLIFIKSLQVFK